VLGGRYRRCDRQPIPWSQCKPLRNGIGGDLYSRSFAISAKGRKPHGINGSGRSAAWFELRPMKLELAAESRNDPARGMSLISVPGTNSHRRRPSWSLKKDSETEIADETPRRRSITRKKVFQYHDAGSTEVPPGPNSGKDFALRILKPIRSMVKSRTPGGKARLLKWNLSGCKATPRLIGEKGRDAFTA